MCSQHPLIKKHELFGDDLKVIGNPEAVEKEMEKEEKAASGKKVTKESAGKEARGLHF